MRVTVLSYLLSSAVLGAHAQADAEAPGGLVLSDAIGLHLGRAQVFDAALDAWTWTFGQEPGAHVDQQDRTTGVIEGHARVNFRNKELASREESMGVVSYHVVIRADNGQCTIQVGRVVHTGNHSAQGGGLDVGPIYAGDRPAERLRGISRDHAQRLHAEIRDLVNERLQELMRAFAARLRRTNEP